MLLIPAPIPSSSGTPRVPAIADNDLLLVTNELANCRNIIRQKEEYLAELNRALSLARAEIITINAENNRLRAANRELQARLGEQNRSADIAMTAPPARNPASPVPTPSPATPAPPTTPATFSAVVASGPKPIKRPRQVGPPPRSVAKPAFDVNNFLNPIEKPVVESSLTFVFFKNLPRRPMSDYRKFFDQIGFASNLVRDIMFCSDKVVQFLTYENVKEDLIAKVLAAVPAALHLPDADPCDPTLYSELGPQSR